MAFNIVYPSTRLERGIINYLHSIRTTDLKIATIINLLINDKDVLDTYTKDAIEYLKTLNYSSNNNFINLLLAMLLAKNEEYKKSLGYLYKFIKEEDDKPITIYVKYFIALFKWSEFNSPCAFLNSDPSIIDNISTEDNIVPLLLELQQELKENNYEQYQKFLNRAKALYPHVYKLHLLQATFYQMKKNQTVYIELSIIEFKKCLNALKCDIDSDQYNFDLAENYHLLAVCYSQMPLPDIQKIVKYCDLALLHDTSTEGFSIEQDIRKTKALAYIRYKGFEYVKMAEKEAEKLVEIDPESIDGRRIYQLVKLKTVCSN